MPDRVKRLVLCVALFFTGVLPHAALATDFTDAWFAPQESGWGVNVVQSDGFLFVTFFIYGADSKPTWYTAQLTWDGTRYSGGLYATQGTFWANAWNPADHPPAQQVGTASFQPDAGNAYQATLAYAVNGGASVTKTIVRTTLTQIALGGNYLGAQAGSYSGCSASANNGAYADKYGLSVTQSASGTATLTFVYDGGATCTLSGTLRQYGQLYDMPNASYQCSGKLTFTSTATVYEMKATAQGLEGRLVANLPSGCQENANFSGVLL
jgi:hypothetical protein